MGFDVAGSAYGRFMGRYSEPLAAPFAEFAGIAPGDRVLDVGCGPGALTSHLATLTAPSLICAVDPSPSFVAAISERCPEVTVQLSAAEALPFPEATFDATVAELVVHFMRDPVAGLREMARVTREGGTVAACVWDGSAGALGPFWEAVHALDPDAEDESHLAGARRGHLAELFDAAGLLAIQSAPLSVEVVHPTFDEWWEPYTLGVGPAGDHVARLDAADRARLADMALSRLGHGPFTVTATAWAARGVSASGCR